MQTFRDLLEKEGMRVDRETVELPVTWNLGKKSNLKLIRIQGDRKFERSEERPILPNPDEAGRPFVTLDLFSHLQSMASGEAPSGPAQQKNSVKLKPQHTAFFDTTRVYDRLLRRKQQNGWHNLVIRPETVQRLLQDTGWYDLYMPHELYLIRNLTRGRGVSFFDDFGYYPDFIVWLKNAGRQHVIFLDPKGLSRFGSKERKKVELHRDIRDVEKRIRETEPDLYLHSYVLSVTPAQQIDGEGRSPSEWKNDGVFFLNEPNCLKQVIEDVLEQSSAA